MRSVAPLLLCLAALLPVLAHAAQGPGLLERARRLLREVPLVDGHNDLPWQYRERTGNRLAALDVSKDARHLTPPLHTDLPRLREGGVGGVFWSVYVPVELAGADAVQATLEQMDVVHRLAARHPDTLELALTADDVRRIHAGGRVASLIGVEGGHSINGSLGVLRELYRGGARYLTLTHSKNVPWCDSATDAPQAQGLTDFGRQVVREMNRLGMLVDLSHVSARAMHAALDASRAPVVFTHSSAFALVPHPRNVPDEVLARLRHNGGLVMVTFVPLFVSEPVRQYEAALRAETARTAALSPGDPEAARAALEAWKKAHPAPRATLAQVADHVDHVRRVAGVDHVGLGGDYDGITSTPEGLEGVDTYPALLAELLRRGWSDDDVKKLAGLNLLRVLARAEAVAAELQQERGPEEPPAAAPAAAR